MSRLREIAERLGAIARELESPDTGDERARELASEVAELSAEAVEEATRGMREAESEASAQ
jgi:enoyl-CoA hydratase/carnithine racemase